METARPDGTAKRNDEVHDRKRATSIGPTRQVLDIEREIKRLHIGLAVRLKNHLTPEQQQQHHKMPMDHHMRADSGEGRPIHPVELLIPNHTERELQNEVVVIRIDYNDLGIIL